MNDKSRISCISVKRLVAFSAMVSTLMRAFSALRNTLVSSSFVHQRLVRFLPVPHMRQAWSPATRGVSSMIVGVMIFNLWGGLDINRLQDHQVRVLWNKRSVGHSVMLTVDEHFNGREVSVSSTETIALCLIENRMTGYRWIFKSNGGPVCTVIDDSFTTDEKSPGAAGKHCWHLRIVAPGTSTVELFFMRPWEQDKPPARTFKLKIHAGQ